LSGLEPFQCGSGHRNITPGDWGEPLFLEYPVLFVAEEPSFGQIVEPVDYLIIGLSFAAYALEELGVFLLTVTVAKCDR